MRISVEGNLDRAMSKTLLYNLWMNAFLKKHGSMSVSQPMKYKIFADATSIAERTEMPSKKVRKPNGLTKFAGKDIVTGQK